MTDLIARLRAGTVTPADLDAAADAIEGRGWQPIETAPKDGTRVLVHSPETHTYTGIAAVWCIINERWEEWGDHYPCHPTHWKPLDPPPVTP
jgi:hypothetical protein